MLEVGWFFFNLSWLIRDKSSHYLLIITRSEPGWRRVGGNGEILCLRDSTDFCAPLWHFRRIRWKMDSYVLTQSRHRLKSNTYQAGTDKRIFPDALSGQSNSPIQGRRMRINTRKASRYTHAMSKNTCTFCQRTYVFPSQKTAEHLIDFVEERTGPPSRRSIAGSD